MQHLLRRRWPGTHLLHRLSLNGDRAGGDPGPPTMKKRKTFAIVLVTIFCTLSVVFTVDWLGSQLVRVVPAPHAQV